MIHDVLIDSDYEIESGNVYFFGIAIDQYTHMPHLNNAVKDVQDIASLLVTEFQFKQEHVHTYFNDDATRGNIISFLHELTEKIEEGDDLLIYFAGHGSIERKSQLGYWVPYDGKKKHIGSYISHSEIISYIREIPTRHTVLLADSCFSGAIIPRSTDNPYAYRVERFPSRWILTSGRKEIVSDGKKGKNSPFARSILTYLKYSNQRDIPMSRLIQHVKENTARNAEQTPMGSFMFGVGDQGGEFVFHSNDHSRIPTVSPKGIALISQNTNAEKHWWDSAREKNQLESYKKYRDMFPKGKYVEEAQKRISQIKEIQMIETIDWNEAIRENTVAAIQSFMRKHPKGQLLEVAKFSLRYIEWDQIKKRNEFEEIRQYCLKNPSGKYLEDAE